MASPRSGFVRLADDESLEAQIKGDTGVISEYWYGSACLGYPKYRISGYCDKAYRPVLEQIKKEVAADKVEWGAQCCAYVGGVRVVDLMIKAFEAGNAYTRDSVQKVQSIGKNLECVVVAMFVEKGLLRYDMEVAEVWPEYAQHGKEATTIAHVMRHEAGLSAYDSTGTTTAAVKSGAVSAELEALAPDSVPGTVRAYHAMSRGMLVNEIVRRVDPKRRTLREIIAEDVATPIGMADYLSVGVPAHRQDDAVVTMMKRSQLCCATFCCRGEVEAPNNTFCSCLNAVPRWRALAARTWLCVNGCWLVPCLGGAMYNTLKDDVFAGEVTWESEKSSADVYTSARAIAKVGAAVVGEVDGVRLVSPAALQEGLAGADFKKLSAMMPPFIFGPMDADGEFTNFGMYHYKDDGDTTRNEIGERGDTYGWLGFGGSAFQICDKRQLSFAWTVPVANLLVGHNPISRRIINVLVDCEKATHGTKPPLAMERS